MATAYILAGIISIIVIATSGVVAGLRRLGFRNATAVLVAGLVLPFIFAFFATVLFIYSEEVDGPPPGNVIGGIWMLAAVWAVLATPLSYALVRWLVSRER